MRLKSIHLENFCQHTDLTVDFPSGTLGVLGGNGQGKSNIMRAVRFALTGESGNAGNKAGDLNWQAAAAGKSGFVELKFEAGGEEGVLKRFVSQTRASLKHGSFRTTSSNEATKRTLELCGVSKGVIENIIFVDQGKIETILFEKPADRAKKFQQLFGTESAEKLRQLLHQEVALLTTDPVDERIVELQTQLDDEIDPALKALNNEKTEIAKLASSENLDALNIVIDDFEEAVEAAEQLMKLEKQLHELNVADPEEINQLCLKEHEYSEQIKADQASIDAARAKLLNNRQTAALLKTHQDLVAEINTLTEELSALVEPTAPSVDEAAITASRKQVAIASSEVARHQNFITTFETGEAVCPTCNQVVQNADGKVEQSREIVVERSKLIAQVEQMLEVSQKALTKYEGDSATYKVKILSVHQGLEERRKKLAELPEVVESDVTDSASLSERVDTFDELVASHKAITEEIQKHREEQASTEGTATALSKQIAEVHKKARSSITEDMYEDAKKSKTEVEALQLKIAGIDGQLKQLHVTRVKTLAELEGLKSQAGKLEAKRKYKRICERARDLLHRDVLPKSVTQRYLSVLNHGMNEHLALFGSSFSATITDDLEVLCNFPGVGNRPAARLSGGLKTLLGVAFRFAVCKLFASSLGFVVLDEPTAMLDDNNVQAVVDLLQIVKGHAANAGLQLVVITHRLQIMSAVDEAFRL